jgi:hypothetical protein
MFSTFARVPDFGRRHALSKHNQRAPNADHVVHHGRSRLVCRWRPDPTTRKPLCSWEIDDSEAAPSGEQLPGRPDVCPGGLLPNSGLAMREAGLSARSQTSIRGLEVPLPAFRAPQRNPDGTSNGFGTAVILTGRRAEVA